MTTYFVAYELLYLVKYILCKLDWYLGHQRSKGHIFWCCPTFGYRS